MKKQIVEILSLYVDAFGFVSVNEYVEKRNALHRSDRYHEPVIDDDYKTVITLGLSYPSETVTYKGKPYGILSRYSYGRDYHLVFGEKVRDLCLALEKIGLKVFGEVDSMRIDERFAASLAKMGFRGKNQFLIHPTYGTYLYLATVLIDQEIASEDVTLDDCGDCTRCVDLCPTNALDGRFHMDRCISYTTQAKIPFTDEMRKPIKRMVYGCDVCQIVCPKNKGIDVHKHLAFEPDGLEQIDLIALLEMTNKEYKALYQDNASSWTGLLVMKRNAIVLLANQKVTEAIPLIEAQLIKYKDVPWFVTTTKASLKQLKRVENQ